MRIGVAIGANLGDRLQTMRNVRDRIRALPEVRSPFLSSAVYETEPVNCEPGAKSFLNAVMEFDFCGDAFGLLRELRALEAAHGRATQHTVNTSRTIDLDLLYCGDQRVDTPVLQLPHPRIVERRFVLQPLADIRPDLILPRQMEPVAVLLGRLPIVPAVVRSSEQW